MENQKNRDTGSQLTADTLFDGAVACYQYGDGYRFSVDAVIIAHFVEVKPGEKILDLGAGCGIIPLILQYRHHSLNIRITGIEVQERLANLARENISRNHAESFIEISNTDIRQIRNAIKPESYTSVVCNPPYYRANSGRISHSSEAAAARHQIFGDLGDFAQSAAYAVKNRGEVYFIYPSEMLAELFKQCSRYNLEPSKLQLIYSYPEAQTATLAAVKCRKNGGPQLQIEPPFFIYSEKNGAFSEQMQKMYNK